MTTSSSTSLELPCPECFYDLRGLPSGCCPECGTAFDAADLRPTQPGLALERWRTDATTWWKRALLPWRVGFAPLRAFRRECPINRVLTESPLRYVGWIILAYVVVTLATHSITYVIDDLCGIYPVFGGQHEASRELEAPRYRYCSLMLLPAHLPITWLQGAVVCMIGMGIKWRRLTLRKMACLATWVMSLSLFAAVLATAYETAWDTGLIPQILNWTYMQTFGDDSSSYRVVQIADAVVATARDLRTRGSDLLFGLLAGLAVGTVVGRRRWLLVPVAALVLYLAFPLYGRCRDGQGTSAACTGRCAKLSLSRRSRGQTSRRAPDSTRMRRSRRWPGGGPWTIEPVMMRA